MDVGVITWGFFITFFLSVIALYSRYFQIDRIDNLGLIELGFFYRIAFFII